MHLPQHDRTGRYLLALSLFLTALVYIGTFRFGFVLDDPIQITNNPLVKSWTSLPLFFTHHVWAQMGLTTIGNFYRPLFSTWLLINYQIFGDNPAGWHMTTVAMHMIVVALVFFLARRVLRNEFAGGVAALVFALHPAHVESVAWVSGVTDPLGASLMLGSLLCYLHAVDGRYEDGHASTHPAAWYVASCVLFALALLAKETEIILPLVVAAYELLFSSSRAQRTRRAKVLLVGIYFAITGLYLALRTIALHGFVHPIVDVTYATSFFTAPTLLLLYVRHLFWPVHLGAFYAIDYVDHPTLRNFVAPVCGCIVIVLAWVLLWWRSRAAVIGFAGVWLALPLLPVLNLRVFQPGDIAHDRYLYLPVLGLALIIGWIISKLDFGEITLFGHAAGAVALALVLAVGCSIGTATESLPWANTLLLLTRALDTSPNRPWAMRGLAMELVQRGRYEDAVPLLRRVVELSPRDYIFTFELAQACYESRRYEDAERYFQRAHELEPKAAAPLYYLGMTAIETHRFDDAEQPLRQAIEFLPRGHGFHYALGLVLNERGDAAGARREFESELRVDPANDEARQQLTRVQR
jgi:Tfp pilus assembly protein PilF